MADVYDALTSRRPYRAPISSKAAIKILTAESGRSLDSEIVREFLIYIKEQPLAKSASL